MAIQRNAGDSGNLINQPGEYAVRVHEVKSGKSKKGSDMLTVTFETPDAKQIRGYFAKNVAFHMKALEALKEACGLNVKESAGALIGKSCGILVEVPEANGEGRVFAGIVGYGPVSEVKDAAQFPTEDDGVPF